MAHQPRVWRVWAADRREMSIRVQRTRAFHYQVLSWHIIQCRHLTKRSAIRCATQRLRQGIVTTKAG